jgi:hypothetical protein
MRLDTELSASIDARRGCLTDSGGEIIEERDLDPRRGWSGTATNRAKSFRETDFSASSYFEHAKYFSQNENFDRLPRAR